MENEIDASLKRISDNFQKLRALSSVLARIAAMWLDTLKNGNKIIFCGNGGSAADAQHLAAELVGRYKFDRAPLAAVSLATDTSALTAIGNDYGYEEVFARQLGGIGKTGDALVGISTSGNSPNVIRTVRLARKLGIKTAAFTGEGGGELKKIADICLAVPSAETNHIQEMHIACGHIICGLVEEGMFPKLEH